MEVNISKEVYKELSEDPTAQIKINGRIQEVDVFKVYNVEEDEWNYYATEAAHTKESYF